MPEEMAVLDPVNADQPVETPGEPEREVAETEIQAATESEEQEPSPSPIEGLPEEELENEPRVQKLLKDREARLQESYRQRELAAQAKANREALERAYLENAQRAANANWQWGHSYLQQVATEALNKGEEIPQAAVQQVATELNRRAIVTSNEFLGRIAKEYLTEVHPNYRVPQELDLAFKDSQLRFNPDAQAKALMAVINHAEYERLLPLVRAQVEQELAEKAGTSQKVAGEREAANKNRTSPRPTNVNGQPASRRPAREVLYDSSQSPEVRRKAWNELHPELPAPF